MAGKVLRKITFAFWSVVSSAVAAVDSAAAQVVGYQYDQVSSQGHLFKLFTGGFGSLVMIFMALGGFATLVITRQGPKGKQVPIPGILMLLIAGGLFAFKVCVRAGVFGHEYIEW